jgi:hypothetical protein
MLDQIQNICGCSTLVLIEKKKPCSSHDKKLDKQKKTYNMQKIFKEKMMMNISFINYIKNNNWWWWWLHARGYANGT